MLKKTIPYIDLNGVQRKEDFYFHLCSKKRGFLFPSVKAGNCQDADKREGRL